MIFVQYSHSNKNHLKRFQHFFFYFNIRLIYPEAKGVYFTRLKGSIPKIDLTSFSSRTNLTAVIPHRTIPQINIIAVHKRRAYKIDKLTVSLSYF